MLQISINLKRGNVNMRTVVSTVKFVRAHTETLGTHGAFRVFVLSHASVSCERIIIKYLKKVLSVNILIHFPWVYYSYYRYSLFLYLLHVIIAGTVALRLLRLLYLPEQIPLRLLHPPVVLIRPKHRLRPLRLFLLLNAHDPVLDGFALE